MRLFRGQEIVVFHGALHENTLLDLCFFRDNGVSEGFAGWIAAEVAIDLRQVLVDLERPLHLLHGCSHVVVHFVH